MSYEYYQIIETGRFTAYHIDKKFIASGACYRAPDLRYEEQLLSRIEVRYTKNDFIPNFDLKSIYEIRFTA